MSQLQIIDERVCLLMHVFRANAGGTKVVIEPDWVVESELTVEESVIAAD